MSFNFFVCHHISINKYKSPYLSPFLILLIPHFLIPHFSKNEESRDLQKVVCTIEKSLKSQILIFAFFAWLFRDRPSFSRTSTFFSLKNYKIKKKHKIENPRRWVVFGCFLVFKKIMKHDLYLRFKMVENAIQISQIPNLLETPYG